MTIAALATPPRRRAIRDGLTLVGVLGVAQQFLQTLIQGGGPDQPAYWGFHLETLYRGSALGGQAARLYSPAFFQVVAPLSNLPYAWFVALWAAIALTALVWMVRPGPWLGVAVVWVGIVGEIPGGNIHMLMAAAIVIGFRYPEAWSFVLLTKVLPGLGLLWFPLRGEWRPFLRALAATAIIAAMSAVAAPQLWADWISLLVHQASGGGDAGTSYGPFSLPLRMAIGLVILVWGARTDRRWVVPITAVLASPILPVAPSMLVACIPLARWRATAGTRAASPGNDASASDSQDAAAGTRITAPGPS